jgi:Na+/glutamate symporter
MDGMLALTIVCVVFAIGDFISDRTHAVIPVLLFATIVFLILFWTGTVPTTLFTDAGLIPISNMMTGLFIVNMGTLLDLKQFIQQWKVVALGLAIVIVGGILMFFVSRPVLGNNYAVALVGPITGGWVSAVVVNDAIKALGSPDSLKLAGVLATIIVAVQGIIGYPLASLFLRKEATRLVKGYNDGTIKWQRTFFEGEDAGKAEAQPRKKLIPSLPARLQTPFILLGKSCIVSLISFWLSGLTGGAVHRYVICLVMGVIAQEIGFLEHDVMKKSNCYGIGLVVCMVSILVFLTAVTPADVAGRLPVVFGAFVIGLISMFIVAVLVGKIFGFSWQMCCGITCSCLFGFPGTYVVSTEVAKQISTTDDEQQMILDNILPKMLVAGFICLTITSVLITGVFVNYLIP